MEPRDPAFVLGQRYTMAALALGLALLSFLNLAGMEKAIVAVVLGLKALQATPEPRLEGRRQWAQIGIGLSIAHVVLVVTLVAFNFDRLSRLFEALRAMSDLR